MDIPPPSPRPLPPTPLTPPATATPRSPPLASRAPARASRAPPAVMPGAAAGTRPHASPGVGRFARDLGVDITTASGSGPKGRILTDDIQRFVKQALAGGAGPAGVRPGGGL